MYLSLEKSISFVQEDILFLYICINVLSAVSRPLTDRRRITERLPNNNAVNQHFVHVTNNFVYSVGFQRFRYYHKEETKTLLLQLEKVKYFCKRNNNINKLNQKRGNGGTTNAQRQVTTHCLILAPAALLKHQPI